MRMSPGRNVLSFPLFPLLFLFVLEAAFLASCKIPVLAVCGDSDGLVTAEYRARIASECKNVRLEILPECGHNVFLEYPERTLELLREFI